MQNKAKGTQAKRAEKIKSQSHRNSLRSLSKEIQSTYADRHKGSTSN